MACFGLPMCSGSKCLDEDCQSLIEMASNNEKYFIQWTD